MDGTERTLQASLITMNFAPQSARILVLIFLALSLYLNGSFGLPPDAKCYVPNGDIAPDNFPCFLAQGVSACCGANAVCLSTGLCAPLHFTSVSNVIRGTCTDPTWSSRAVRSIAPVGAHRLLLISLLFEWEIEADPATPRREHGWYKSDQLPKCDK